MKRITALFLSLVLLLTACTPKTVPLKTDKSNLNPAMFRDIYLAGGCFWGVDYYMRRIPGVLKVEVGYTGGNVLYPTYSQV